MEDFPVYLPLCFRWGPAQVVLFPHSLAALRRPAVWRAREWWGKARNCPARCQLATEQEEWRPGEAVALVREAGSRKGFLPGCRASQNR